MKDVDIIIVGGGIVGLALACGLAKQTQLRIALCDKKPIIAKPHSQEHYDFRVSAITLASRRLFENLAVWDSIVQKRVSPFVDIHVWDSLTKRKLHFSSQDIVRKQLGYIIENEVVQSTLVEKIQADHAEQIELISPLYFSGITRETDAREGVENILLRDQSDQVIRGRLLIAADGTHSWVRSTIGCATTQKVYEETAIVATLESERSHEKVARQVFYPGGVVAALPLDQPQLSSIVWSVPHDSANQLLALSDDDFANAFARTFDYKLGSITKVSPRYHFPLLKQEANHYIQSCIALVGDAAHTIHPLAGLGLNNGLLDAAALIDVIVDALQGNHDFANRRTLRKYERWRKADHFALATGIDLIKNVFAANNQLLVSLRDFGVNMTNDISAIRRFFTRYAVGDRKHLPRLFSREI